MPKKEDLRIESDEVSFFEEMFVGLASGGLTMLASAIAGDEDSFWIEDEDGNVVEDGFKSRKEAEGWIDRYRD